MWIIPLLWAPISLLVAVAVAMPTNANASPIILPPQSVYISPAIHMRIRHQLWSQSTHNRAVRCNSSLKGEINRSIFHNFASTFCKNSRIIRITSSIMLCLLGLVVETYGSVSLEDYRTYIFVDVIYMPPKYK